MRVGWDGVREFYLFSRVYREMCEKLTTVVSNVIFNVFFNSILKCKTVTFRPFFLKSGSRLISQPRNMVHVSTENTSFQLGYHWLLKPMSKIKLDKLEF